jgi:tetratricopeptide (TPR) repeat protein
LVGAFREAFNIAERVAHLLEGTPTPILARVWSVASGHAYALGLRDAAMQASRRALAVARECGDEAVLAGILRTAVIFLLREHGIAEAEAALQEAESLCSPTARIQVAVAERRALLAEYRGDPELAIGLWEDYRRLNASYGNLAPLASHRVAVIAMKQQNLPLAISYCRQLLDEGSNELFATALSNLLGLLLATDAFDEARRTGAQLLSLMRRTNPDGIASAVAIEYLALAAAVSGEMQRAGRLEGYAGACFRAAGYVRDFLDSMTYERLDAILRANLAARDLESLLSEGSRWTSDEALAEADRVVLPERLDDAS